MSSVTVVRNVHHNNLMFIYQLVPTMEQIALSLSHGGLEEGTHKDEGKTDETGIHPVGGVEMVSKV
jgi:hypothetical protein